MKGECRKLCPIMSRARRLSGAAIAATPDRMDSAVVSSRR